MINLCHFWYRPACPELLIKPLPLSLSSFQLAHESKTCPWGETYKGSEYHSALFPEGMRMDVKDKQRRVYQFFGPWSGHLGSYDESFLRSFQRSLHICRG